MKGAIFIACLVLVINGMLVAKDIIIQRATTRILFQAFLMGLSFWVCVICCIYYTLKIGGLL